MNFAKQMHELFNPVNYLAKGMLDLGPTYNVHKRSLPIGTDIPVLFGLSEDEAKWWTNARHTKIMANGTIIYYDTVLADDKYHSVYENKKEIQS